jgi:uncharacterized protein (TIGR02246 family)
MALGADDVTMIQQLYAAYCLAIDDGDGGAFSACFTPDGSLGGGGGDPLVGPVALSRFVERVRAGVRHVATNVHVEGEGDSAQGRAYLAAYSTSGGVTSLLSTGRYRDELVRNAGKWRFSARHFTPDG